MKNIPRNFNFWVLIFITGFGALFATPAFSMARLPPVLEDFESGSIDLLVPESSSEGRITVVGDTSIEAAESVPNGGFIATYYSGASRLRGNYYQCDETVGLTKIGMYLGCSQSTEVTFAVYESGTSGGTYSLIASDVVTASIGTNIVESTSLNTVLEAGKFYMIGMAWNNSSSYRSGGAPKSSFSRPLNRSQELRSLYLFAS